MPLSNISPDHLLHVPRGELSRRPQVLRNTTAVASSQVFRFLADIVQTKRRTLEEIGEIFGDKHVAAHWYGISEEEKAKIAREAMRVTEDGRIIEDEESKTPAESEKVNDEKNEEVT